MEEAAVLRWVFLSPFSVVVLEDFKFEFNLVNWVLETPGEVLLNACQERLGKEEARDPEDAGFAVLDPVVEHLESLL